MKKIQNSSPNLVLRLDTSLMLSFLITLLSLVSRLWQKAVLWFFMTTCVTSCFVLSVIQSLSGESRC
ncbi:hypothetical protein QBC32DRAFT_345423 [Pseudoneurospora amorphoporcata]|uniref:Uncharacterized protein n=1 Tax=Pseudoneurospora amorphoporcata TaxID=241081 RepID=A0AAN6SEM8_9PEZI|nr:hypothetical protein QBC32DRAFT_345423 [Pseudoneurospora amorphoporcata]